MMEELGRMGRTSTGIKDILEWGVKEQGNRSICAFITRTGQMRRI